MKTLRSLAFILCAALFAGAAGAQQEPMVKSTRTEVAPEPGKALVIFVRSSFVMGAYSSPVFHVDAKNPDPKPGQPAVDDRLIGILSKYSKVAYQAEPGDQTFMSVPAMGGEALIAKARLQAGKTYYFLVKPNWGMSPSYSLMPLRKDPSAEFRLDAPDLGKWLAGTEFYEATEYAQGWVNENRSSIMQKKAEALRKWNAMPEAERKLLMLEETDSK
jgi:hypothetical protein